MEVSCFMPGSEGDSFFRLNYKECPVMFQVALAGGCSWFCVSRESPVHVR